MPLVKAVSMSPHEHDYSTAAQVGPLLVSNQVQRRERVESREKLRHRYSAIFEGSFDAKQLRKQLSVDVSNTRDKAARRLSTTICAAINASSSTAIALCAHGNKNYVPQMSPLNEPAISNEKM